MTDKATKEPAPARFKVLIPVRDDKSGKAWKVGAIVKAGDFPAAVIADWLRHDPPVLERIEEDID